MQRLEETSLTDDLHLTQKENERKEEDKTCYFPFAKKGQKEKSGFRFEYYLQFTLHSYKCRYTHDMLIYSTFIHELHPSKCYKMHGMAYICKELYTQLKHILPVHRPGSIKHTDTVSPGESSKEAADKSNE